MRWSTEAEAGRPYWWADGEAEPFSPKAPQKADILVIGAGYTGLSAAITAHDAGAKVVVVDAGQPGNGASTRNGGMFGAHPRLSWPALAARFGAETANGLFAEAKPALQSVQALIARENIDCDLQNTGRIQLAWTRDQFAAQKQLATHVREKSDVQVEVIERDQLDQEIATKRYFGGVIYPEHCSIQPRKFHDGLVAAVQKRDIAIAGDRPVAALERDSGGFIAKTPQGDICASKVILATNGYTPTAFRWHQRRVFPLPSYMIATEPLPANLLGHLAPGRRMMVETRARHSYFRLSPDGTRILFGGRASMRNLDMQTAARRMRETMLSVWPELADAAIGHVWTGNTGFSFTHTPSVGEDNGLHYALGYSGSGAVMAPYLGAKAALRATGSPGGETAYANTPLQPSWLHPFAKPYFLNAADLWYRMVVDRRETMRGR